MYVLDLSRHNVGHLLYVSNEEKRTNEKKWANLSVAAITNTGGETWDESNEKDDTGSTE